LKKTKKEDDRMYEQKPLYQKVIRYTALVSVVALGLYVTGCASTPHPVAKDVERVQGINKLEGVLLQDMRR
jgi:hypothetical protein